MQIGHIQRWFAASISSLGLMSALFAQQVPLERAWTPDLIADLLDARSESIRSVEFMVEVRREKAKDHDRFFSDSPIYDREIARYLGTVDPESDHSDAINGTPIKPKFFRVQATGDRKACRIAEFIDPPNVTRDNFLLEECFSGVRWTRYYPAFKEGPRVHIADSQMTPDALSILGLGVPQIASTVLSPTFAEVIRDASRNGHLSSIEEVMGASTRRGWS